MRRCNVLHHGGFCDFELDAGRCNTSVGNVCNKGEDEGTVCQILSRQIEGDRNLDGQSFRPHPAPWQQDPGHVLDETSTFCGTNEPVGTDRTENRTLPTGQSLETDDLGPGYIVLRLKYQVEFILEARLPESPLQRKRLAHLQVLPLIEDGGLTAGELLAAIEGEVRLFVNLAGVLGHGGEMGKANGSADLEAQGRHVVGSADICNDRSTECLDLFGGRRANDQDGKLVATDTADLDALQLAPLQAPDDLAKHMSPTAHDRRGR